MRAGHAGQSGVARGQWDEVASEVMALVSNRMEVFCPARFFGSFFINGKMNVKVAMDIQYEILRYAQHDKV